jgi:hypothetical protein
VVQIQIPTDQKQSRMKVIPLAILGLFAFSSMAFTVTAFHPAGPSSFGNPVYIGPGFDPNLRSVGSNVYIAWTDRSNGIYFRESGNDGQSWGTAVKIGNGGNYPIMSANSNYVYVVWSAGGIVFTSSSNYGAAGSWSQPMKISSGGGITPYIASDGDVVAVVYLVPTTGSYVLTSVDGGKTWTKPFLYSNGPEPQVAVSGPNVYAIADKLDRSHAQFAVSHDSGKDWVVNTNLPPGSEEWIVASGSYVYAAWETKSPGSVIYFLSSSNNGTNFSTKIISAGMPDSWNPMINSMGTTVWVGIQEFGSKQQNWMLTSTNSGSTWASQSVSGLGHANGFIFNIATTDGKNIFAMWIQKSSPYSSAMVAYSGNGGNSWTTVKIGQSDPNNDVAIGSIASDGSHGLAAWQDNSTIYFAGS